MTLQTQVASPHLAATWGRSWMEWSGKLEHQLVCQRTLTSHKAQTERDRDTWRGHPGPSITHSAGGADRSRGCSPDTGQHFPSTSLFNCKWINCAADTERMRQRETGVRWLCILIFSLMTTPATHLSPNRYQSTACRCMCLGCWWSYLLSTIAK